jgi:transposase
VVRLTAEGLQSPYDPQARYRTKCDTRWTACMVHPTETCDEGEVHPTSHVATTDASVHEVRSTAAIYRALAEKGLAPGEHLVDAAYV